MMAHDGVPPEHRARAEAYKAAMDRYGNVRIGFDISVLDMTYILACLQVTKEGLPRPPPMARGVDRFIEGAIAKLEELDHAIADGMRYLDTGIPQEPLNG